MQLFNNYKGSFTMVILWCYLISLILPNIVVANGLKTMCNVPTTTIGHIKTTKSKTKLDLNGLTYSPLGLRQESNKKFLANKLVLRGGAIGIPPVANDLAVSAMVIAETFIWLKLWSTCAKKGFLASTLTRKIIHAGSAPLFMMHWPLFSDSSFAPVIAASIPLLQIIRLFIAGKSPSSAAISSTSSKASNQSTNDLVTAVSRTGKSNEALGGPLIYSIVLLLGTAFYFRNSPIGVVAISQMAAGDGLADIIGRRFGKLKWPFNANKSIIGSIAFVIGGFTVSYALLAWLSYTGYLNFNPAAYILPLLGISVLSALVELIGGVDDNISVPLVAAIASWFLFPHT